METTRILAVTPPGSMERVVSDLRGELYRLWGCVSALALPAIVPVAVWPLALGRAEAGALLARAAGAMSFALERYERAAGYLYLAVSSPDLEGLLARLKALIPASREDAAASGELFPSYPGFLLAGPDLAAPLEDLSRALPIPAERRFGSYALSILCVRSHAPRERWWDLVSWEEEAYVPVKRSGRAAPGSGARAPAPSA